MIPNRGDGGERKKWCGVEWSEGPGGLMKGVTMKGENETVRRAERERVGRGRKRRKGTERRVVFDFEEEKEQ